MTGFQTNVDGKLGEQQKSSPYSVTETIHLSMEIVWTQAAAVTADHIIKKLR